MREIGECFLNEGSCDYSAGGSHNVEHFGIFDALMKRTANSPNSNPNLNNHLIGDKDLRDKFDRLEEYIKKRVSKIVNKTDPDRLNKLFDKLHSDRKFTDKELKHIYNKVNNAYLRKEDLFSEDESEELMLINDAMKHLENEKKKMNLDFGLLFKRGKKDFEFEFEYLKNIKKLRSVFLIAEEVVSQKGSEIYDIVESEKKGRVWDSGLTTAEAVAQGFVPDEILVALNAAAEPKPTMSPDDIARSMYLLDLFIKALKFVKASEVARGIKSFTNKLSSAFGSVASGLNDLNRAEKAETAEALKKGVKSFDDKLTGVFADFAEALKAADEKNANEKYGVPYEAFTRMKDEIGIFVNKIYSNPDKSLVEELRSDKELLIRIDNHIKMDSLPDGNMLSTLTLMENDIQLLKDKFPTIATPTTTPTTTKKLEYQAMNSIELDPIEQTKLTSVRKLPSLPKMPKMPSLPQAPKMPSLPKMPKMPSLPSVSTSMSPLKDTESYEEKIVDVQPLSQGSVPRIYRRPVDQVSSEDKLVDVQPLSQYKIGQNYAMNQASNNAYNVNDPQGFEANTTTYSPDFSNTNFS